MIAETRSHIFRRRFRCRRRRLCLSSLFSMMVDDTKRFDSDNGISKYADDIIVSVPVSKYNGYSKDELSKLFDSLRMSLFLYGLEVWVSACQNK